MNRKDKDVLRKHPAMQALMQRLDEVPENEENDTLEDISNWSEAQLDAYLAERDIDSNQAYSEFKSNITANISEVELDITDFKVCEPGQDVSQLIQFHIKLICCHDNTRSLELSLDRTDYNKDWELKQEVAGHPDNTRISIDKHSIEFEEGFADLSAEQIRQIAQNIDLLEPYLSWGEPSVMFSYEQFTSKISNIQARVIDIFNDLTNIETLSIPIELFFSKNETNLLADCFRQNLFSLSVQGGATRNITGTDPKVLLIERVKSENQSDTLLYLTWKKHPVEIQEPKIKILVNNKPLEITPQWQPEWSSTASLLLLPGVSIDSDGLYTWFWDPMNNQLLIAFRMDEGNKVINSGK